jgi:Ankyrin repeats (3 copies)
MIKVLFWMFVALDAGAILLFFVLGLAAAGSTKDSPMSVTLLLLVLPAIPLLAAIAVYLRSSSPGWRAVAFALAAAPVLLVVATQAYTRAQFKANSNAQGDLTFFTAGPMREIVEAIRRHDAATVAALVPKVDVNGTGMADMTLLVIALRQLRTTPDQHEVVRVLLKAGADPNKGVEYEIPLEMALQVAAKSGPEPVRLLLEAGANPNALSSSGTPLFFAGTGNGADIEILKLLIKHGADLDRTGSKGERVLFAAANGRNWKAVLFLLEQGVDARVGQTLSGQDFRSMLEANASWASADSGYADVVAWLKTH